MLKPCATRGCPELVERGTSHCDAHRPPPWFRPEGKRVLDVPRREWERLKRIVWRKAKGRCARCGSPGREVNHIVPRAQGGPTVLENLELLCVDCHKADTAAIRRQR
jgi:5-methylcytosine-specific restriction protein A